MIVTYYPLFKVLNQIFIEIIIKHSGSKWCLPDVVWVESAPEGRRGRKNAQKKSGQRRALEALTVKGSWKAQPRGIPLDSLRKGPLKHLSPGPRLRQREEDQATLIVSILPESEQIPFPFNPSRLVTLLRIWDRNYQI
ncbi:hypothetical protein RF11_07568 [Thelohanellus kitauei]|uniref:Uncharacterized protein n=1 Tax=Thelohanellus kitauei TaxID=669202 RepID=A0A0C2IZQ1_THEKT|nr:hypothetical protein RF11_07568 [Thelohanellus kitauei]